MNCQEVVEYMHRYLDQDLDPEETAQMYRHVAVCPACAEKFNMLKSLSRDLEDLPAVTPPYSLVDSILPQLDAIDRARQEQIEAENDKGPALMVPELKRSRRTTSWWGSVAGRTAIGTAAAAVILGVAIFNYEPKMLSDAELSVEETMSTSMKTGSDGSQELPDSEALQEDSKEDSKNEEQAELKQYVVEDESQKSGAEKSDPDVSVSSNMKSAPTEVPDSKSRSANPNKGASELEDSTKGHMSNLEPQQDAHKPAASHQQLPVPEGEGSKDNQDTQTPSVNNVPTAENGDTSLEDIQKFGIADLVPEQWVSPDGIYSASLEIDQLVLYRLPPAADQLPEVMLTLPVNGDWVGGEWSEDSQSFTYTVLVDQKEVKNVFNVQQPIDSSKPEADKPAESDKTEQTDKVDKTEKDTVPEKSDKPESEKTP